MAIFLNGASALMYLRMVLTHLKVYFRNEFIGDKVCLLLRLSAFRAGDLHFAQKIFIIAREIEIVGDATSSGEAAKLPGWTKPDHTLFFDLVKRDTGAESQAGSICTEGR